MARYIKANPKEAHFLRVENPRFVVEKKEVTTEGETEEPVKPAEDEAQPAEENNAVESVANESETPNTETV